jgi:hypothetical protein
LGGRLTEACALGVVATALFAPGVRASTILTESPVLLTRVRRGVAP